MVDFYYTFFQSKFNLRHWISGYVSKTDLKKILVLQNAALPVLFYVKLGKRVTSFFPKLKITLLNMLFEFRLLKTSIKNKTHAEPWVKYKKKNPYF